MNKSVHYLFLLLYVVLGILQSILSEPIEDEAYYWVYAQNLDFGYFDHPPMVAFFIHLGQVLFESNLGLRILFLASFIGSIHIWYTLIKPKSELVFHSLISSIVVFHVFGIFAVPDLPLLLFTSLFLWQLKEIEHRPSNLKYGILGLLLALVFYSKYHGILLPLFMVLAQPKLFKSAGIYIMTGVCILFFLPHIYWQVSNDFPTLKFHLFNRVSSGFSLNQPLEYLGQVLMIFGPFAGILLLIFGLRKKPENAFEKYLKYLVFGGILFFLLMSFRGRTEGNWIIFFFPALVVLGYPLLETYLLKRKSLWIGLFISFALLGVVIRGHAMFNLFPGMKVSPRMHEMKSFAFIADSISQGHPMVFMNSYQKPSLVKYHTQAKASSYINHYGRPSQYQIWNLTDSFAGDTVVLFGKHIGDAQKVPGMDKNLYAKIIPDFRAYESLNFELGEIRESQGSKDSLELVLNFNQALDSSDLKRLQIFVKDFSSSDYGESFQLFPVQNQTKHFLIKLPKSDHESDYGLALNPRDLPPGRFQAKLKF